MKEFVFAVLLVSLVCAIGCGKAPEPPAAVPVAAPVVTPAPAAPADTATAALSETLKKQVLTALERLEKDGMQEHQIIAELKAAGASFLPALTADPAKCGDYQAPERQREMLGVYLMDMSYAAVFNKKQEALKAGEACNTLMKTLGFTSDKAMRQYQQTVTEVSSATASEAQSGKAFAELDAAIEAARLECVTTRDGMDLAIDASYGWIIEGLYIASELAAQNNYAPKYLAVLEKYKPAVDILHGLLDTLKADTETAKLVEAEERDVVLDAILEKISGTKKLDKASVDEIRKLVTAARQTIVGK